MMTAGRAKQASRVGVMVLGLLVVALSLCSPASAQEPAHPDQRAWYVSVSHWAKWPMLAGAFGFTAAAILQKHDADNVYDQLQALCRSASENCILGPAGTYVNPEAESLYQQTLALDGKARRWMIGGESTLALSGVMFLLDLVAGHAEPKNIPFTPFEVYTGSDRLGLQWRF
jgi:hypothetical protein